MTIVGGLDVHRKQITFDYVDTNTGLCGGGRSVRRDAKRCAAGCRRVVRPRNPFASWRNDISVVGNLPSHSS